MTERLIPFDIESAKADPSRVRWASDARKHLGFAQLPDGGVAIKWGEMWCTYSPTDFSLLRLTAPAPKRVEVRAALWSNGRFSLYDDKTFSFEQIESGNSGFVRWLTNWHIEGGKVFVEVE